MGETTPVPEPLISTPSGNMVLTRDAFIILKGKTGSGKSRLLCNLMKGLITGDDDIGFVYNVLPSDSKILYVNTELGRGYLLERYKRMADVCGLPRNEFAERVKIVDLQPMAAKDRLQELWDWVKHVHPDVVLIDQGADFVEDLNLFVSGSNTAEQFTSLQSVFSLAMIVVLHQNEEARDASKSTGSIGTALERKSFSSIVISAKGKYHEISSTKMRNGSPLPKMQVKYNDQTDMFIKTDEFKAEVKADKPKLKIDPTKYTKHLPCVKGDLEKIIAKEEGKHENTAKARLREAIEAGVWYEYKDSNDDRKTLVAEVVIGYGLIEKK